MDGGGGDGCECACGDIKRQWWGWMGIPNERVVVDAGMPNGRWRMRMRN